MSLFKRAAARGVAYELVRRGLADFSSKEAMDAAADTIGDHVFSYGPDLTGPNGQDPEKVAAVADQLVALSDALKYQGNTSKFASESLKLAAQATDLPTAAYLAATGVMHKAAAETALVGNGSSAPNTEGHAASSNDVAKLDLKNRAEGQYEVGKGNTTLDTSPGEVGKTQSPTVSPSNAPSGTNSVNEESKKASLAHIRKLATALLMGQTTGNHEAQAAHHNDVAQLDLKNRPTGYAVVRPGGANFSEAQVARVGLERKPDVMPSRTVSGTNSVIEASKAAQEQSVYLDIFRKTASDVGPYLPGRLNEEQKIAAIQQMMPLNREQRGVYLDTLKRASEGGLGALMKDVKDIKNMEKDEKKDRDEDEEKEKKEDGEGEKESALLDQIRSMARSAVSYR